MHKRLGENEEITSENRGGHLHEGRAGELEQPIPVEKTGRVLCVTYVGGTVAGTRSAGVNGALQCGQNRCRSPLFLMYSWTPRVTSVKLRSDPLGRPVSIESTSSTTMLCSVRAFLLLIQIILTVMRPFVFI